MTHIFSYFSHKSVILIKIYHQDFYHWFFFTLILLFHLILRNNIVTQRSWKVLHNLLFMIWFHWFKGNYCGQHKLSWRESNFSIRPPRIFKILSTTFQWTQTIQKDLVERSAYAMILGNNTKFIVNYLYVAGSNLGH